MRFVLILFILISYQYTYAQWEKTNWKSGPKLSLAFAKDSFVIIKDTETGNGVRLSNNYGKSWSLSSKGLKQDENLTSFAVKGSSIFSIGNSLWVSNDCGVSWNEVDRDSISFTALSFILSTPSSIITANNNSIYFSIDEGQTWHKRGDSLFKDLFILNISNISDTIIVLSNKGIYITEDFGVTWIQRNNGILKNDTPSKVAIDGNNCFVGTNNDTYNGEINRVYYSSNTGQTWHELKNNIVRKFEYYNIFTLGNILYIYEGGNLYVSHDTGTTWSYITKDLPEKLQNGISNIFSNRDQMFLVSSYELWTSPDLGKTWNPIITGNNYGLVHDLSIFNGSLYVGTGSAGYSLSYSDGIFCSQDEGLSWRGLGCNGLDVTSIVHLKDSLLIGTNHGVAISSDKGNNWFFKNNGLPSSSGSSSYVYDLIILENKWISLVGNKIFSSDNKGDDWALIEDDVIKNKHINCIAAANNNIIISAYSELYLSTDIGTTWKNITANIGGLNLNISSIAIAGDEIYLTSNNGVFFSSNLGSTWKSRDNALPVDEKYIPISLYIKDSLIFTAVLLKGVYYSKDKGRSWIQTKGINNNLFYEGSFTSNEDYIFFGTNTEMNQPEGDAIYRAKFTDFLSSSANPSDTKFALYPNPAVDVIYITYIISSNTDYLIFDCIGQVIQTGQLLENQIDISMLPSGAFFLKIGNENRIFFKN